MSITQIETPLTQPQVTPVPMLDVVMVDMINAVNAYIGTVDMLQLTGPARRTVDQNSPVFRALAGAVQQLRAAQKTTSKPESASTLPGERNNTS